ncbi:MAG: RluA family pseudouridine synthase [Pyrinomonadaceae bacterium]
MIPNEDEENSSFILHPSSFDIGKRLDVFLSEKIEDWSRVRLQKLIDDGNVLVNQKPSKSSYKLRGGEQIEVELTKDSIEKFEPQNIPLDIIYEDEFLAVINKPAGMVVHPGAGVSGGTLANAIAFHFKFQIPDARLESEIQNPKSGIWNLESGINNRIGIVHRLDKNTSDLIVVAKNESVHENLSRQFGKRAVSKNYVALVHGRIETQIGKIETSIGRDARQRTKMAVFKTGREALTLWKARQKFDKFTLLDVEIKTGRTHQIRVHLASINHGIVGDETYNAGRDKTVADAKIRQAIQGLNRFFLHAERLSFTHPKTLEKMNFVAPLPPELTDFLKLI